MKSLLNNLEDMQKKIILLLKLKKLEVVTNGEPAGKKEKAGTIEHLMEKFLKVN